MVSDSSRRIERGLREMSEESVSPAHRNRIQNQARLRVERNKKMNRLFGRTAMAGGFCALLFIGLLFIPVSYDLCIGSVVEAEWDAPAPARNAARIAEKGAQAARERADLEMELARLRAEIAGIDGVIHSALEEGEGVMKMELCFAGKKAEEAERTFQLMMAAVLPPTLLEPALKIEEVRRTLAGNVLAWASGGRIVINGKGLSPEELEEAIVEELIRHGAGDAEATVEITDDDRTVIDITIEDPSPEMIGDSGLTIEITNE